MIEQNYSLKSLLTESTLLAKCILADDAKTAVKNALALSCISQIFNKTINSDAFFKNFLGLVDPHNPFYLQKQAELSSRSFKNKYLELRSAFSRGTETIPGTFYGDVLASIEGLEILFIDESVISLKQKDSWKPQSIQIPAEMEVDPNEIYGPRPFAARSEKYLAINRRSDSTVYLYDAKGEHCLAKYSVLGEIRQIAIKDDLLFVLEQSEASSLNVFKLDDLSQKNHITISNVPAPYRICFGKTHLIFKDLAGRIHILPISFFNEKYLEKEKIKFFDTKRTTLATNNNQFILPKDDHFIIVNERPDKNYIILKIKSTLQDLEMPDTLKRSLPKLEGRCSNACVYNDRIFFAFEKGKTTQIVSYDILSDKVSEPICIPKAGGSRQFFPRFLNVASNIYYLIMDHAEGHLTTLTFGKI